MDIVRNDCERLREGKIKATLDKLWNFDGVYESYRQRIHRGVYISCENGTKEYLLKEKGNGYQPVSKTVYEYFNKVKDRYVYVPQPIELPDMEEYLCYVDSFLLAQIKKDFEGYEISIDDLESYLSEVSDIKIPKDKEQRKEYVKIIITKLKTYETN